MRGKAHGTTTAVNRFDQPDFTEQALELFVTLTNPAAIAIHKALVLQEVQQLAITDDLTGLYSRRYFFAMVEREVERAASYSSPLSLIVLDADQF